MSYTALTPAYFDAVIAGSLGGMMNGQATTSTNGRLGGPYLGAVNASAAVAQEIDTLIGAVTPTVAKANVLIELSRAWFTDRNPSGNANAATPSSYAAIAAAIVECWTLAIANLQ